MSFVNLHTHSDYSVLDSSISIKNLVRTAKAKGMPALALTDHGNTHGHVHFYKECKKQGIKPILGCEVYVARRSALEKVDRVGGNPIDHLVLLAKNQTGYENLLKLVSWGYQHGMHYMPRIDLKRLSEHSEGLIATAACLSGSVNRLLTGYAAWDPKAKVRRQMPADYQKAREFAMALSDILGPHGFFLEAQRHGGPHQDDQLVLMQEALEREVYRLAADTGLPVMCSNDIHFENPEDAAAREMAFMIARGGGKNLDGRRWDAINHSGELYVKSYEEMMAALPGRDPTLFSNTLWIAEQCNVELETGQNHFAQPIGLEGPMDDAQVQAEWNRLITEGFSRRYSQYYEALTPEGQAITQQDAWSRVQHEKKVIEDMGYVPYFLVVADFVQFAHKQNIPVGAGRGSAAGCAISYLMGITNVDPLPYGLLFERFLNPERISMPDIDIDFCKDRVSEVIDYCVRKYGRDRVARISTFGHMWAKQVFRDVGRVLEIPDWEVNKVSTAIPKSQGEFRMSVTEAIETLPEVQEWTDSNDPRKQQALSLVRGLEGVRRSTGTHACGVVIGDAPLSGYTALMPVKENDFGGILQSLLDMDSLESLGLLKYDFLALDTLTIIARAQHWVRRFRTGNFNIWLDETYNDPATYDMIQQGLTLGAFQIETGGMRELAMRMRPANLEDLGAILALYRPGPLDAIDETTGLTMVDNYVLRKQGQQDITYPHPSLEPILRNTYGILVYQEQIIKIAQVLCGYSLGRADILRKGVGKKKPEIVAKEKKEFIPAAIQHSGIQEHDAEKIWHLIEVFARYGFNKSHSIGYAVTTYQTMYLKTHYPVEFMASALTAAIGFTPPELRDQVRKKTRKEHFIKKYIRDCELLGIRILPANINISDDGYIPVGNDIRMGLGGVKGVGTTATKVVAARVEAGGRFSSYRDMVKYCVQMGVGKGTVENLILSGACDELGERNEMLVALQEQVESSREQAKQGDVVPFLQPPEQMPAVHPMPEAQTRALTLDLMGAYLLEGDQGTVVGMRIESLEKLEEAAGIIVANPGTVPVVALVSHNDGLLTLNLGTIRPTSTVLDQLRDHGQVKES